MWKRPGFATRNISTARYTNSSLLKGFFTELDVLQIQRTLTWVVYQIDIFKSLGANLYWGRPNQNE